MTRPLRIEFLGAVHHVTSRGDQREPIYQGDRDAALLLGYREGGLTMTALAHATGLSVSRVSRVIAARERVLRAS